MTKSNKFHQRVAEQRQQVALDLAAEIQLLKQQRDDLLAACKDFAEGWGHFCKKVNFNSSFLDAKAIRWMNEVPGKIGTAIAKAKPS